MLRLEGGTHFLLLRTEAENHYLFSFSRFDDALSKYDGNSRLSPLFAIDGSGPPAFQKELATYLTFLGPIYPGDISLPEDSKGYLTLGILNVAIFCSTEAAFIRVKELAVNLGCGFECWTILGHLVTGITHFFPGVVKIPDEVTSPIPLDRAPMIPTAREFQTLVANVLTKNQLYNQSAQDDFLRFNSVFRNLITTLGVHDVEKLQSLTTANVSLARFIWQTFGGSSPLIQTSIQIATHSFLGIGTASLALQRLARFVEGIFEKGRISDRLRRLKDVPAHAGERLLGLPATDQFWNRTFLSQPTPDSLHSPQSQNLPQITSYSARDGFRSTSISLSAPIEVITGCNTPSWTLQTLTHEISHTQLRSIMGMLLPDPADDADLDQLWQFVNSKDVVPPSLFWQLRVFLVESILWMRAAGPKHNFPNKAELVAALRTNSQEANEILTHLFDFMYFYRKDSDKYIRSIWVSWATIPHIHDRVSDYITRTLCVLHCINLRRDNSYDISFATFEAALHKLEIDFPDSLYIPQALHEIQVNQAKYLNRLRSRTPLVKFGAHFLWSSEIAADLNHNIDLVTALKSGDFTEERSPNPLGFIAEWSQDKAPEAIRSIWILQHLAHGGSRE
jgi:hypothetical protein